MIKIIGLVIYKNLDKIEIYLKNVENNNYLNKRKGKIEKKDVKKIFNFYINDYKHWYFKCRTD